jgi:phosphoenolpyruvate---glycerone phosphotransferase subunit DhaL
MQKTTLYFSDLVQILNSAAELICQNQDELCQMDAVIGDGDHGITMARAMNSAQEIIKKDSSTKIDTLLRDIAWALMDCDGGATGPLYGSLFLGMSDSTIGKDSLDGSDFAFMLESGLESIQQQTKAKVGDKTMMDALIPAVLAAKKTAAEGWGIPDILKAAVNAAREGSEYTKNIPARYGRAKYQGDRTIGYPDPGSVSIAYMFQGFLNGLEKEK